MKTIYAFGIILLLVSFNMKAQSFNLIVNNGYGSGVYNEGDTIHVWSNIAFSNTVFVNWTGSGTNYLTFDNEWHTTLIVPLGTNVESLTINANFDVIPATTQIDSIDYLLYGEDANVQSNVIKPVFYAVPSSPKAVVFLLHGTNGKGSSFFTKFERYELVKDLVYDGYAVFTLDANEQTMGDQNGDQNIRWDNSNAGFANSSNNVDILNIETLRDSIINTFSLPQDIPSFTLGMSAGAGFSDICASALGFNASAHVTAKGKIDTYTRSDIVPVIWILAENDHEASANNAAAYANFSAMSTTQTAEWHWFKRSPVYSDRFLRSLNNISETQADSFYQRLQTNGYIDFNGYMAELDVSLIPTSIFANLGLSNKQKKDITQQMLCINADHVLHSDYDKNIVRFFNQKLFIVSIEEKSLAKQKITIYPNPTSNMLKLKIDTPYKNLEVSIYATTGKKMLDIKNQTEINISAFAEGIYFLRLQLDEKNETHRIVKR